MQINDRALSLRVQTCANRDVDAALGGTLAGKVSLWTSERSGTIWRTGAQYRQAKGSEAGG